MEQLISLLPEEYAGQLKKYDYNRLEEIRFCAGQPLVLRESGKEVCLWPRASSAVVEEVLRRACRQSLYAYKETLRHGFVTVDGGHRIGVCGTGVLQAGELQNLIHPSSLVLRVARERPGVANRLLSAADTSMLIVGPPCSGKTSLLRDLVRLLSDEKKQRVSLVDERGELAAVLNGMPQNNIGMRTDVLVNIPKGEAIMMLLRTMNPQWIAVDEITAPEDIQALDQASYCGVKLLATAHANGLEDLYRRPLYLKLMERNMFAKIVELGPDKSYHIREVEV